MTFSMLPLNLKSVGCGISVLSNYTATNILMILTLSLMKKKFNTSFFSYMVANL